MMKYDLYDFDGTIYDGDSGVDIILFAVKRYPRILPILFTNCFKYFFKIIDKKQFKSNMFSFVKYIDDINKFVLDFWYENEHKLKSFWLNKKSHKNDIIISASGFFWLKYISDKYKVADLIATNIDIKTGEIIGDNCLGKEKVKLFYEKYPNAVINKMYTDSINDLPLIKEAQEGFMIKNDKVIPFYEYKPSVKKKILNAILKIYNSREIFCYLVAGALTVLVNLFIKWSLLFTIFDKNNSLQLQLSVILSWIGAVIFAYIINRFYVFKSKNKKILKESINFLITRIFTLIMEMFITWVLFTLLKINNIIMLTILIQIVIIVLNYLFSKIYVFKINNR